MQLGNNYTFGPVNDECSSRGHVRDHTQVHVLNDRLEILVLGIGTVQLQFGLERNTVGQPPFDTLFDGIARRIDEIIKEFEHEIVTCIGYREILGENLVQSFINPVLGICLQLEKILEGFYLNVKKVRVFSFDPGGAKANSFNLF